MFGDEMMKVPVLRREVGICGAVIETYVFLSLDRFEQHRHLFWFLN